MFVIAETSAWLENLAFAWSIAQMAIGLGVVIFVHELGHFLAAKSCGVKCEKFYLGFDVPMPKIGPFQIPSKLVHFQYGETEYGIGIVPLGGYVKMLGQDDNPANAEKEAERTRVKKNEDAADDAGEAKEDHHKTVGDTNLEPQPLRENVEYELDPRSYTAKSVPQRMLIISAGVIMNVIFAVVFATIAYGIGVPYMPAVIGAVSPGSPAWEIDLPRGAQVLRVGDEGEPKEKLRFRQDMAQGIVLHGADKDLSLLIREPGGEPYEIKIRPVGKDRGQLLGKLASIGVANAFEPILGAKDPLVEGFPAAQAKVKMQPGDRIVAGIHEGQETKIDDYWDLHRFLSQHVDDTITLRVVRETKNDKGEVTKADELEVELATRPLRRLGLVMTMGPLTAIQVDSPAQDAQPVDNSVTERGIQKGDVLKAIDGEPLDDPMIAPHIIRRLAGREVVLTVARRSDAGKSKDIDFKVTPRPVADFQSRGGDDPVLVDALGLTYAVKPTVTAVDPRCTAKDKFQPGDKIIAMQIVPAGDTPKEQRKNKKILTKDQLPLKELDLTSEQYNWTTPFFLIQGLPDAGKVKLTYQRGAQTLTAELRPFESSEYNFAVRGMVLKPLQYTHTAESWGEAVSLGLRETKESLLLVVTFLKKLVSGDISPTALGGPGTIAAVATSEASRGLGPLLIFLTMLSANLAVVNFLPIPVLDGGHMMFLLWEGIFRRPVPEAWQIRLTLIGFGFILCLMAFVIGLDIYRLGGFGS